MRRLVALAVSLCLAGCPIPLSGRRAASRPLPGAARPIAIGIQPACGRVRVARPSPLVRAPYLQLVTHERATIAWTSTSRRAEHVETYAPEDLDVERIAVHRESFEGRERLRTVELRGLSRRDVRCYELRAADGSLLYGPVALRAAPEPGSTAAIDVVALGDSGGGGGDQLAVRDAMEHVPADLILHAGDLAYPASTSALLDARVFHVYESLLRSIPLHPVLGNHDTKADGGRPYLDAFVLPENGGRERWYSFDWGMLHVAAIDTEQRLEEQARWLDRDLGASDAPWKILLGHRPAYSSGWHGSHTALRETIVPVLERHGAQLSISGHDHHYERSRPIGGVTYLVTGGGGHSTRPVTPAPHADVAEPVLHFVHLRVTERTLTITAIDATGAPFDVHVLER
jgi:hypothetical protein